MAKGAVLESPTPDSLGSRHVVPRISRSSGALLGFLALLAAASMACGGAAPLLHPAATLPVDSISVGAGVSGEFASSNVGNTIDRGRSAAGGNLSDPVTAHAYANGVLMNALVAPGASPWVSARVGLPQGTEAGLTYTGRSLRVDGRYAFELMPGMLLSVGLGASGLLISPDHGAPPPTSAGSASDTQATFDLDAKGGGADIPVLLGCSLIDGFAEVWLGPRFGVDVLRGDLRLRNSDPSAPRLDASGTRLWAGAVAGFSLGVPPLWLRFELGATYHDVSGSLKPTEGESSLGFDNLHASGWTLAPSGAIVGKF
jgi:hypothetical protein